MIAVVTVSNPLMKNEGPPVGSNTPPVGVGDIVCMDDASLRMLVVDLGASGCMVTVSWKDARGLVFETTLKSAKLTVLRRARTEK